MSKIKVYVRVRPPLPGEFDQPGVFNCVEMEEESGNWINIKKDGENTRYFARCWGARSSQEEVYRVVGVPTVNDVFEGYFGTIFVYGQTGTGKTFTLGCSTPSLEGVQPRAIQHMFDKKEKEAHKYDVEFKMQYVQLYRDSIQDLLNITKDNLMLRVDDTGATIEQVTTRTIQNYEEGMNLVKEGDGNRVVANTKMNSASSRSHACLITYIRRKNKETGETTEGRLYLIDLAGSERVSKSGVTGDAYQEAVAINKSLTTLGNCIAGIVNGEKVVAFRDSKLTRLLQHSLSGHGRTSIIVTIRPDSPNMQETLCTLKFGERAQKVEAQMTPAGFRDQVLDKMLQVGDIQAASADAAAKSRAYQILAVKLDQDCVTKEAELKEAEEEARQRIAEATSELISLQKECDAKVASESEAAQNQAKEELEALRKSNASVMKEVEDRVSAAVSKATKELTTLQAERKEKIRSLTEKVELLREKTSKLKPISANMSEQEIVSQKTAEINEKIEQIQKQIKSCRTSPHENLSLDELELKRETLIDLLYRLEEHYSKLQDGMQGWDMKVIEKKKHMPTDEEVEMYMLATDNNKDDEDAKADSDSSAPPPSDSSDDSDTDDSSDDSSNSSSSGDKKEKDDKGDQTVERKQFDITCQKERGLQDLVDQVTTYLEYGTTVYRLTDRGIQPQHIYINPSRTSLFITMVVAGEERGEPLEMLPLDAVQNIVNGQSTPRFMKMRGNRRPVGRDFAVPATSEQVDDSNIEEYVYRSFSLFTKAENYIDLVCNTDTDYEGWTVLLHRLTHISPTWAQPMDLEGLPQEGLLNEKEREMCAMAHITPECYFRTREATLIVEQQMFLTLVDVRTASGMDLIHSQKMFEFFTKQGWIERQVVHQQKYRDQYLEVQLQKNEQERRRLEEATSRQAGQQRKDRLRGMFKKYRIKPEDGVLEDLLIAYSGNEDKIIQQLVKKYGPEPDPGELVLLIRPPKAERTEQRQLFSAIVTLAMCSDPPRPIPRIQDMTPAMLIDFRKTGWDQGAEDPVVVELTNKETNQGTYYYLLSDNREVIVASLREITSSCLTKAILSIPELTVSNKIDPMLTIMTNDLNESTKAQQLLETITEYVRNAMTRCSQDVVNVMASSPNFLGKLKIDISNPRKPVLPNLLLRSCWYADKIQGMIEDSLKDEYDMIFVMLSAMRKQLIEKRPSLTLCDPPSAIDFLHNVILPWLEAAYTKAQDEFCECVPSDVSQRVSELLEGKHFVGGSRLKPNEHPPKVQKDSIDDVCSPRTTKK